jgi:hypothetical protein
MLKKKIGLAVALLLAVFVLTNPPQAKAGVGFSISVGPAYPPPVYPYAVDPYAYSYPYAGSYIYVPPVYVRGYSSPVYVYPYRGHQHYWRDNDRHYRGRDHDRNRHSYYGFRNHGNRGHRR